MKTSPVLFLKRFYGENFNREFAKDCNKQFNRFPCFNLVNLVEKFRLYQNRGCSVYISVYNFHSSAPLNSTRFKNVVYPYKDNIVLDRIFLDFDKALTSEAQIAYDNLLSNNSKLDFYKRLIEQGQAKNPIQDAKNIYNYIKTNFGGDPTLVFSGAKGCHLYIHFNPINLLYPKEVISHFVNTLKTKLNLKYLDPAVVGDFSRVSRIPTSVHPKTGLYTHPFKINYTYDEIVTNSHNKKIPFDNFDLKASYSDISHLLCNIDNYFAKHNIMLHYKNKLTKHTPKKKYIAKNGVKIDAPNDILKLNQFYCFHNLPYSHDSRLILALICLWSGLTPENTLSALRIFAEDKGYYDPTKHLHDLKQIKSLKKYSFTCNSMKKRNLCPYKNKFCGKWFYLKLILPDKFYKLIKQQTTTSQ